MMNILKNPIILAIIVGIVVFVLTSYYTKEDNKKSKKNKNKNKNKKKKEGETKETAIILAVIASLGTWFLAYMYLDTSNDNKAESESDNTLNILDKSNQVGGSKVKNNIPSITSDEVVRSYNLLGTGLNIPRAELKIPNVLIDYN